MKAQNLMQDRPFVEGQVVEVRNRQILVRLTGNGRKMVWLPAGEVFFFRGGDLLSAGAGGVVTAGTRVMVPTPAPGASSVAGSRETRRTPRRR